MKVKYFMIITIFCLVMLVSIPMVQAATIKEKTYDREMAIASALSYVPLKENKPMGFQYLGKIKEIVNYFNEKITLHNFAVAEDLDGWIVADFHGDLKTEITEKSLACFVLKKGNDLMIIFRGTDMEFVADVVHYGLRNRHNQEKFAIDYVEKIMKEYSKKKGNYNIYVGGHSLGGYLAQIAGAHIEQNLNKYNNLKLRRVVTFNGIGMNFFTALGEKINYGEQKENIETLKKLGDDGRLVEYYIYGDLVSALGVHYGEMRMLLPSIDSVGYHRTNFKLLDSANKALKLSKTFRKTIEKDNFNIFKTEIDQAAKLYDMDSWVGYLMLTHESDGFTAIENKKSSHKPVLKTVESNVVLSELKKDQKSFEINKSITVKAVTSFASAKKYVWEISSDKKNWKEVKVSTVDVNDPKYNKKEAPTNTYKININDFKPGETKYIRITSYYDDNYVSSKFNFNTDKGVLGEYEYVVNENKSRDEKQKTIQKTITVKRKEEQKIVKTIKTKINNVKSKITNLFKKR